MKICASLRIMIITILVISSILPTVLFAKEVENMSADAIVKSGLPLLDLRTAEVTSYETATFALG